MKALASLIVIVLGMIIYFNLDNHEGFIYRTKGNIHMTIIGSPSRNTAQVFDSKGGGYTGTHKETMHYWFGTVNTGDDRFLRSIVADIKPFGSGPSEEDLRRTYEEEMKGK